MTLQKRYALINGRRVPIVITASGARVLPIDIYEKAHEAEHNQQNKENE